MASTRQRQYVTPKWTLLGPFTRNTSHWKRRAARGHERAAQNRRWRKDTREASDG